MGPRSQQRLMFAIFLGRSEVAEREREDIELIHSSDIIARAPEAARKARQPLKWVTTIPGDGGRMISASVIADDLFALRFDDDTESYFLVEIDRGHMPVRRNGNLEEVVGGKWRLRTHYVHKLATYWHGWRQGRHVEQFGVKQLRVLTITTSARRIETMLDALHEVTGGKGSELFLFVEDDALRATSPLDAMWITGKGRRCRITE